MLVSPGTMAEAADDEAGLMFEGTLYLLIGIVLCIPFAITPLLPAKPWVWIYGIVLIAIGMTSACCLPATIPLLVFWIKPEVKSYFGRES